MPVTETLTFPNDQTPLDLLLWRRFRQLPAGFVEQTLALNYGLADLGPLPPAGTKIVVQVPAPKKKPSRPVISLYA